MKRLLLFAVAAVVYSNTYAQIPDKDQWTCAGTHENLHTQLNAGKTVIIAMQGLDCTGCIGNATHVDTLATNNKGKIRIWSALQLKAGSGGTCAQVGLWEKTHGYNDVFTFLDSSNYWMKTYPGAEWLVIDPFDKKIKYQGLSRLIAFAEAQRIAGGTTSVGEVAVAKHIAVYPNPAQNHITIELLDDAAAISLHTIDGRTVLTQQYTKGQHNINIAHLPNGVYVLEMLTDNGRYQTRVVKKLIFIFQSKHSG